MRSSATRPIRGGRLGWFRPALLAGLFGTLTNLGNVLPSVSLPEADAQPQMAQPAPQPYPQTPKEMPLDVPLRIIAEARQRWQQVNDYQCLLVSQERVKGNLLPETSCR
jgi:hypothetical protein